MTTITEMNKKKTKKLLQGRTLGRSEHLAETNNLLGFYLETMWNKSKEDHWKVLSDLGLKVEGTNGELLPGYISSTHRHFAPKTEQDWEILERAFDAGVAIVEVTRFDSFNSEGESWAKNVRGNHRGW